MTVKERLEALESELAEIRKYGGRGSSSETRALRRIAMLTEDQHWPASMPKPGRRFS